jgi:hypothetical protein
MNIHFSLRLFSMLIALLMMSGSACYALPTPPAMTVVIDAYTDSSAVGFWLYSQDGAACDSEKWSDSRRVDIGMPTRSADGLRDEWTVQPPWGLKATDCLQLTARDAAGNESAFATVAAVGNNVGWFGIPNGKNVTVQ